MSNYDNDNDLISETLSRTLNKHRTPFERTYTPTKNNKPSTTQNTPTIKSHKNIFVRLFLYIFTLIQSFVTYVAFTTFDIIMRTIIGVCITIVILAIIFVLICLN